MRTMNTTTKVLFLWLSIVVTVLAKHRGNDDDVNADDLEELQQLRGTLNRLNTYARFNFSSLPKPDRSKKRCAFVRNIMASSFRSKIRSNAPNRTLEARAAMASQSIHQFFRVSAPLYYFDMFKTKKYADWRFATKRTSCFLCGNMVPDHFAAYQNRQGGIVYGVSSYIDSLIGDYQIDLWRLAIGIVNTASHFHFPRGVQEDLVNKYSRAYYQALRSFAHNSKEQSLVFSTNNTYGVLRSHLREVSRHTGRRWQREFVKFMTRRGKFHNHRLASNSTERKMITKSWPSYVKRLSKSKSSQYTIKDVRRHGAIGAAEYLVLVEGPTKRSTDDVILRVKRTSPPAWRAFAPGVVRRHIVNRFDNDAKRVIVSNLGMGIDVDRHLGWFRAHKKTYVVSEYQSSRQKMLVRRLRNRRNFQKMVQQWGTILATFHSRSDRDYRKKYIDYQFEKQAVRAIGSRFSKWQKLVLRVAFGYHRQVFADFRCVRKSQRHHRGKRGVHRRQNGRRGHGRHHRSRHGRMHRRHPRGGHRRLSSHHRGRIHRSKHTRHHHRQSHSHKRTRSHSKHHLSHHRGAKSKKKSTGKKSKQAFNTNDMLKKMNALRRSHAESIRRNHKTSKGKGAKHKKQHKKQKGKNSQKQQGWDINEEEEK